MQLFVMTSHCKSRLHCMSCRNKERGRFWREDLKNKNLILPDDNNVDFECPYGIPWDYATDAQSQLQKSIEETKVVDTKPVEPQKVESITVPATKVRDSGTRGCGCGRRRG